MTTPVSGPGQFSERTDKAVSAANRQLPNADYGEQAAFQEQLQGAPLGAPEAMFSAMFGNPAADVVGLGEPTTLPDVPITDGADAGAGAPMSALSSSQPDTAGIDASYLRALEYIANQPGTSDAARIAFMNMKYSL